MSAIVSLLSGDAMSIVAAYRAKCETVVWVLGDGDDRDAGIRSLPRLSADVQGLIAIEVRKALDALHGAISDLPKNSPFGLDVVRATAEAVLKRDLPGVMSLVWALSRANGVEPIDLLLLDDDLVPFTRAAAQWALSRRVPTVRIARRILTGRPIASEVGRISPQVVAYGERGRLASVEGGIEPARVTVFPRLGEPSIPSDPARKAAERQMLGRTYGISAQGPLIVFAAPSFSGQSTFMRRDRYEMSLRAMLASFVIVRKSIPSVQLMLVDVPGTPEAAQHMARLATALGLDPYDYGYAPTDAATSIAVADLVVSLDSSRSIDAALAGVASINLWTKQSWYLGPHFGATDGVLDVIPEELPRALVILLDPSMAAQTVAVSTARLLPEFGGAPNPRVAEDVADHIFKLRRPRRPSVARQIAPRNGRTPDILIHAPQFTFQSAGVRVLYRLAHFINALGADATVTSTGDPRWNAPIRMEPLTERTVIVYPETVVGNPFGASRVVRYCMNNPGVLGGDYTYDRSEMVFYYNPEFLIAAQAATEEQLTPDRELHLSVIEPELFYHDRSLAKEYDCVYAGKASEMQQRLQLPQLDQAFFIQRGSRMWPTTRSGTAMLLRGCRNLYLYDRVTAIKNEALICGVNVFYINEDGSFEPFFDKAFQDGRYITAYYDKLPVQRFLRLVEQRWA